MGYEQPKLDTSPKVSDEVRKTTCYMCACRCGINVHLKSGKVSYIEGNRDHPVNKGVLCAKGASGIMQVTAPSRLRAPLKRVGPRGSGAFEEISWDEALDIAVSWLKPLRESAPEKLAFFTGRDQSQSFTSYWAQGFGTPNYAAHGGFCSVNMAAGGIYTMGGAFWEFGQPDWDRAKLFLLFGVAEDHDSNPIKIGIGKLKARGSRIIGVNPIRSGYNGVADDWYGITPGTDGLLILSLVHELLTAGKIDLDYLARWTNAPCLVDEAEGPGKGLLLRDDDGKLMVIDRATGKPAPFDRKGVRPDLGATHDGCRTVFQHLAERYLSPDYAPEAVAERTGIAADRIKGLASEIAHAAFDTPVVIDQAWTDFRGERHEKMVGRPVAMHAMRGISAHSNGFQTARALHLLQILIGSVETPGGFRFKPPYPKPPEAHPTPHCDCVPGKPLGGPHLGFRAGPAASGVEGGRKPGPDRQGLHLGKPAVGAWADAYGHPECPCRRSLPDRHALPLHGEHVVEFVDEHGVGHGDADRQGRGRRLQDPAHHLFRCLCLRDGGLCRPDPARHDLSGAARLHFASRPSDLRGGGGGGCDPLAGGGAGSRCPGLPVGAGRSGQSPETTGFRG